MNNYSNTDISRSSFSGISPLIEDAEGFLTKHTPLDHSLAKEVLKLSMIILL